jgi:hypothetical protein
MYDSSGSLEAGSRETLESWTGEALESRTYETMRSDSWNSGVVNNSSEVMKKPSQRRYLEKSRFDMWTNGRLVNVWNQPRNSRDVKDVYVYVNTRNIP